MKRVLFIVLVVAAVAGALVVRQREIEEAFPGVTLRFSFWGGDTEIAAIREVCERFERLHKDIRISTEPLPWGEYWLKMKTRTAGGSDRPSDEPPDILRMTSIYGAEWYDRGLLMDVTPFVGRDRVELSDYFQASVDAVTWKGRIRSMPTDSAVRVYMYNKDLFDGAEVAYLDPRVPMTWDELRDVSRRLTVRREGRAVQYGLSLGYMEYQAFVTQAGGDLVDTVVNPTRVSVNSPQGIRALRFYSELIVKDRVSPATRQQQNLGFGAPDWALQSGNVAIQHGGTWSLAGLAATEFEDKETDRKRKLRFGLAPVARDRKRSQVAFTNSCGIYVKSRHPEEAWLFLKFFSSVEGQRLVGQKGIGIPVLREVARSDAFLKSPYGVEHMEVFLDELEHAETNVSVPTGEFRDRLEKIVFDQLCLGSVGPAEAARRMETEGNRLLQGKRVEATTLTGIVIPSGMVAVVGLLAVWLVARARRRARAELRVPSRHENLAGYLFIAPWLVGLVLFALGPVLLALGTSFTDWNIFEPPRYVGAANYAKILSRDREFWQSARVTLVYAATAIPIQMVGGLVCALLLNVKRLRLTGLFRTVLYLPFLFTGVAISIIWRWMYAENGVINWMLGWIGLTGPDWLASETSALPAIVLMNFTWLGGNMIIFLAALQGVPPSLYDAAQVDGAGPLRRFWHVTLPMISPAVLFNLVMGTIWSFQVFAVPRIMTDGGPNDATLFYVLNLYRRAFQYNEMGYACALAFILFVIVFVVTILELRGSRRWVYYEVAR